MVRSLAEELMAAAQLPGLSIAISRDGAIIYTGGFGYADVELKKPVTPDTQFRTASVAKVNTATALGLLVQEGRLDLDAPVQRYVPDFPPKAWPITPRQIAGHISGMPHYSPADKHENKFYTSVTEALGVFSHQMLISEPGTESHYSTHGYTLLSAVIERASGEYYLDFMERAVWGPLGMHATGPDLRANPSPSMAALYRLNHGVLSKIESPEDPSYKWAGGGLISTPSDLVRLAEAYMGGFLKREIISMMFTSQRLKSGAETGVGIAWRNDRDLSGRNVIEHAGSMEGARSVICMYPDEHLVIAVMTNVAWNSSIEETAHMMALSFIMEPDTVLQPQGEAKITAALRNIKGEITRKTGILGLKGGRGKLIFNPGEVGEEAYSLIYLGRDAVYALILPHGIFHMTIESHSREIRGSAIGYGSPQARPPALNPPFLSFEGVLYPVE